METRINVAELLKNCPEGMELDCAMYEHCTLVEVDESRLYPIKLTCDGVILLLSKYGGYSQTELAKCVIFPKGKDSWAGFVPPYEFKDGDIVTRTDRSSLVAFIYKERTSVAIVKHHFALYADGLDSVINGEIWEVESNIRFATEEEKTKLFQAIKDNGYKWDAEKKCLEKFPRFKVGDKVSPLCNNNQYIITELTDTHYTLVEVTKKFLYTEPIVEDKNWELVPDKFDINTLKPFDKVLARDSIIDKWHIQFFDRFDGTRSFPFFCVGNVYNQCIPYKDNEHLRGTADDCDEFYKTWEE